MKVVRYIILELIILCCAARNLLDSNTKTLFRDQQKDCFDKSDTGDSLEESLCYDLNFLQEEIDKIETPRIEKLLNVFSTSLKSYIDVTEFKSAAFISEVPALEEKRKEITNSVNMVSVIDKFSKQLLFTMSEFQSMRESAEYLKCYNVSNLPGHDLIHEVIEINMKIFALQDSCGDIDPEFYHPKEKIKALHERLVYLVRSFITLKDTPYFLKMFFEEQSLIAEARLQVLSNSLSKEL